MLMINDSHTVLLIEDDADDAEMILYTLGKMNAFDVVHIDDGVKAMEYLFTDAPAPAIILLDLKMPKVDGIQILRRLKQDPGRKNIPVVVLISSPDGRRYVQSFNVTPDGYLLKPVTPEQFLSVLAETGLSRLYSPARKDIHRST